MTTNLIEAAERARDALEQIRDREGGWTYEIAQKAAAKLTAAIEAAKKVEPLFFLYCGDLEGNEQGDWEVEADSQKRIDEITAKNPGRALPLFLAPPAQPVIPDGWKEAAIAWEVCRSIHEQYAKKKDPFYTTRQSDFVKHAGDARAMLAAAPEAQT